MSDGGEGKTNPMIRPARRKVLRKREDRDDIFSYRNQIPLSFKAPKQLKVDESDSSDSEDNDEAFQRVMEQEMENKNSKTRESDSDGEDIWITNEKSFEEIDSSASDIKDVSWTTSPSPPPCPTLSESTLHKINQRHMRNPRLRELDNIIDNLKKSTSGSPFDSHRPSSVINVDTLDDSFGLPSPSDRNVVVKVRTRSGIRRFSMKAAEPFGKIISQLAEQEGVTEDKIMLSLSDINIVGYDTPISIKLNVADIIECVVVNVPLMTDGIDAENTDKINIKVQGNDANLKKSFQVSKTEPLDKLMTAYCQFRKLPRSRLKFHFDGDEITGSDTPVDLDMEEDDVIDVRVK